jgi:hypothetical protein
MLYQTFSWLLRDNPESTATDNADRKLVLALWEFEAWRRYEEIEEDGRSFPPDQLGYAVLQKLAALVLSVPVKEGAAFWKPVLSPSADAHYSIVHFISCWFLRMPKQSGMATPAPHWRAMLEYVLAASHWTTGRHWYSGERLLRQLLGCGFDTQICQLPGFQTIVLGMQDLYERWALKHLVREEDNIAAFCGFAGSVAGAPIRLDALLWLAAAFEPGRTAMRWHRSHRKCVG